MIIRGGYNVYPREVEERLHEHLAVAQVVVIGMPHDSLGEEVGAAVVLKPGMSVDVGDLRHFARERLAAYKYPRRIWFVDSLPTGLRGRYCAATTSNAFAAAMSFAAAGSPSFGWHWAGPY